MPHIGEVTRKPARDDQQRVDADVIAVAGVAWREALCGDGDPAQAVLIEGPGGGLVSVALLDLDECQCPAAPGDQVDFASRDPRPPGEDVPPVQPQPPGRDRLGLAAARLGELAVQAPPPSSSARA